MMTTVVLDATGWVVMVNVALIAPAGTVTLAGTLATAVSPLDKLTTAPPEGAGALRVTVPVELVPPLTLAGLSVTEEIGPTDGSTVTVAVVDDEPSVAVIVTGVGAVTVPPWYWNPDWATPAPPNGPPVPIVWMVTDAGTVSALGLELVSWTTDPPEAASALSWSCASPESPLGSNGVSGVTETTAGGA